MRLQTPSLIAVCAALFLASLSAFAQDVPSPPVADPLEAFAKAKEAISAAKDQGDNVADQNASLKAALSALRRLPPSTKYQGHRGEAIEALMTAIQTSNILVMSRTGAPDNLVDRVSQMIDVAQKEIDLAFTAWNGDDTVSVSAPATAKTAAKDEAKTIAPSDAEQKALRSVVIIKGDNSQGTGFLVRTADGPCVITNLHVLYDNPNVKITTPAGDTIATTGLKGASDRDMAMIGIEDKGKDYAYLEFSSDVAKDAQIGDDIMTPGNSKGGEVILPTRGKLLATGNQRVEFDNPIYHGNSGGPVFDVKIGKVLGVVTQAEKVSTSNDLDKASFNSKNSAITGSMRYFGFRIDTVPQWEAYDWPQFLAESKRIDDFHDRSVAIWSYLNHLSSKSSSGGRKIDTTSYLQDERIRKADLDFQSQLKYGGNGESTRARAVEQLVTTLQNVADEQFEDMNRARFLTYNAQCAKDELDFRKDIKESLDHIGDIIRR